MLSRVRTPIAVYPCRYCNSRLISDPPKRVRDVDRNKRVSRAKGKGLLGLLPTPIPSMPKGRACGSHI